MIKEVFNAIAEFLHELYPDYDIYSQYPARDFAPPAFVVTITGGNAVKRLSDDRMQRGIDYQNYVINIFNNDLWELTEATREIKVRLDRLELSNGDAFRVVRKNSNINSSELHSSVSFTIPVSEYIVLQQIPDMENLEFKESMNGSKY